MNNRQKYFVVSLPRTGTKTLCKMARICGLFPKHVPHAGYQNLVNSLNYNFFADTPIFDPTIIEKICNNSEIISKFIYIDKDFTKIFESWKRMGLLNNYYGFYGNVKNFDFVSYNNAFYNERLSDSNYLEIFSKHKTDIINLIQSKGKELLIYDLKSGWEPFCNFINANIPEEEIPHLNINTFFDPY